jgi:hypothetical protein
VAKGVVLFCRWNACLPLRGRIEAGTRHAERREDFVLRKEVEWRSCELCERLSKDDESDVALICFRAGSRDQTRCESGANQLVTGVRGFE